MAFTLNTPIETLDFEYGWKWFVELNQASLHRNMCILVEIDITGADQVKEIEKKLLLDKPAYSYSHFIPIFVRFFLDFDII